MWGGWQSTFFVVFYDLPNDLCHTIIGVHLKLSIYPQPPLLIGGMGEGGRNTQLCQEIYLQLPWQHVP